MSWQKAIDKLDEVIADYDQRKAAALKVRRVTADIMNGVDRTDDFTPAESAWVSAFRRTEVDA